MAIVYRVKSEYVHHASLQGAIGIKIVAPDIGRAVAGTPVMVIREVGHSLSAFILLYESNICVYIRTSETMWKT